MVDWLRISGSSRREDAFHPRRGLPVHSKEARIPDHLSPVCPYHHLVRGAVQALYPSSRDSAYVGAAIHRKEAASRRRSVPIQRGWTADKEYRVLEPQLAAAILPSI
jgi:hypothetical protein